MRCVRSECLPRCRRCKLSPFISRLPSNCSNFYLFLSHLLFYTHCPHMETRQLLIGARDADRRPMWREAEQKVTLATRQEARCHFSKACKFKSSLLKPEVRRRADPFHSFTSRRKNEQLTVSALTSVVTPPKKHQGNTNTIGGTNNISQVISCD